MNIFLFYVYIHRIVNNKMAALLPLGLMAASSLPSLISGIMGIASEAKKLSGGRIKHRRMVKHKRTPAVKRKRAYGKGVVADTLSAIPLLGSMIGPIARAFGGNLQKMPLAKRKALLMNLAKLARGRGLSPMYIQRPYVGMGLYPYGARNSGQTPLRLGYGKKRGGKLVHRKGYYKHVNGKRVHVNPTTVHVGNGLSPMYIRRPYVGMGLLAPAGGAMIRKGHLRKIHGRKQRVRVRPALVVHGGGHYKKKGRRM